LSKESWNIGIFRCFAPLWRSNGTGCHHS
jgi:hypothetical protein